MQDNTITGSGLPNVLRDHGQLFTTYITIMSTCVLYQTMNGETSHEITTKIEPSQ